jgi:energy-coupling factor transporter ATP-binding protein EcfA2
MEKQLGLRLVESNIISEEQLKLALKRQRQFGGRLGNNLLALGYISEENLSSFLVGYPKRPQTVDDTGLELSFIADLIIKHVMFLGEFTILDIVDKIKLPVSVLSDAIKVLRNNFFVEVKGASNLGSVSFKYSITDRGKSYGAELLNICRYVGPAPVTLGQYRDMIQMQSVTNILVPEETLKQAFSNLIVSKRLLHRLGPAVSSGRAIFLYGPSGNGKTTIAETIGKILPDNVYIPHALMVGGEIVVVFDPANHSLVEPELSSKVVDQRWILVRRPFVLAGGELTLTTLDLDFNLISKLYEAPLQMKANNGLFVVDDFGRQQVEPQALINRWIVPLERRTDLLTLHTGMKFEIPFDQLVVFSTNLEPKELVDEAFLRRIRYKIKIDHPTKEKFEDIFHMLCGTAGISFKKEVFDYLLDNYYGRFGVKFNACHPRDIIDQIVDDAHYYGHQPQMTKENIEAAWENYFVEE